MKNIDYCTVHTLLERQCEETNIYNIINYDIMQANIFIILLLFIVNSLKKEKKFILIKIHVRNMITRVSLSFWLIIIDLLTVFA